MLYMTDWTQEYNGAFFLSLATMIFTFLGLTVKFCLKSKCEDINLCGIHIQRRVDLEVEEEKYEIDHSGNVDKGVKEDDDKIVV